MSRVLIATPLVDQTAEAAAIDVETAIERRGAPAG